MDGPSLKPAVQAPQDVLQLKPPEPGADKAKMKEAAKRFEGMLMAMLFQNLRKTVVPSGLLGDGGQARSTYEYLLDQAVVEKAMQSDRGWGLADRLEAAWTARDAEKTW